jgi:hypothetical protein
MLAPFSLKPVEISKDRKCGHKDQTHLKWEVRHMGPREFRTPQCSPVARGQEDCDKRKQEDQQSIPVESFYQAPMEKRRDRSRAAATGTFEMQP